MVSREGSPGQTASTGRCEKRGDKRPAISLYGGKRRSVAWGKISTCIFYFTARKKKRKKKAALPVYKEREK